MVVTKKELGQHWLHDRTALNSIVESAELSKDDTVLEIGPGLGTLTSVLARKTSQVVAVEFDEVLARDLPKRAQAGNITVIHKDILAFDLTTLPPNYKVVANVPYYITSKIVRLLLESQNPPSLVVLLVQKEVAERLAAVPGSMSVLAVSAQFYADVALGEIIKAELFTPPPKVDSQVVILKYHGPKFQDIDPDKFFALVKAGFSERRKKLRSSLAGGLRCTKDEADALLGAANVSPDARAQELSLEDWRRLTVS